jgi:hypothetical protein
LPGTNTDDVVASLSGCFLEPLLFRNCRRGLVPRLLKLDIDWNLFRRHGSTGGNRCSPRGQKHGDRGAAHRAQPSL